MASWQGWERELLRRLRAPITGENISFLREWQRREGGTASFNPLNTTQSAPGAGSYNSVGVRNYRSRQQGLQATVRTLQNGHYGDIIQALRAGKAHGGLASLKTWGTGTWSGGGADSPASVSDVAGVGTRPAAPSSFTKEDAAQQGLAALASGNYNPQAGLAALLKAAKATAAAAAKTNPVTFNAGFNSVPIISEKGGSLERKAAELAQHYLGVKYVWGGASPKGFDCSGLVQWVWGHLGVKVPRTTYEQIKAGRAVKGALRPGDAVFFGTRSNPHHEGMYIGHGMFVEAPHTGAVVRISRLRGRKDYLGARRFG